MKTVILREWSVVSSPFSAPEVADVKLSGEVVGHPHFPDGHKVTTSPVEGVNGRRISVGSGRVYELKGPPAQAYLDFLAKIGRVYNPDQPIEIKNRRAGS